MRRNGVQYSASNTGVIGEVGGKRPFAARRTNDLLAREADA
jgi:hypothetical protein